MRTGGPPAWQLNCTKPNVLAPSRSLPHQVELEARAIGECALRTQREPESEASGRLVAWWRAQQCRSERIGLAGDITQIR